MSCDDSCTFKMNTATPLDPYSVATVLSIGGWSPYRSTDIEDKTATSDKLGSYFSDWIYLTQDEHYYVEATLHQGPGAININVGMEI